MMFEELAAVLAAAPETASREDYAAAIVEGNCLAKATTATRRLSNQRLVGDRLGADRLAAVFPFPRVPA